MDNSSTSSRDPILEHINPLATTQTYFQNAHHFGVNDSQFIIANAPNTTIINSASKSDPVATTLYQYVAAGAIFDSAERHPPGKCHPGTRKTIIQQITTWIDDNSPIHCISWLYGPAGAGKSALAQTICELLAQSRKLRYGGSFFFSRGSKDRGNALKLITTLSYQLSVHFPGVRSEINEALIHDPILLTKSMEIQIHALMINPILQCKDFPSHRPVIIIDGLDECADDEEASTQRTIISLIAKSVVDYELPLRFIIASRPEYWIRDAFATSPLPETTLSFSLRELRDVDRDIAKYLTDEFEKIRVQNKRVMDSVALPWPPPDVIDRLVYEASGQFIYASTVLKFVGKASRFSNPQRQLRIITSPGPHRASAFSELDRLYATILSAYPRWHTMKRVLGGLLAYPNVTIVRVFLDVEPEELVLVLDALSSLIDIEQPDSRVSGEELSLQSIYEVDSLQAATGDNIVFCHLSFREFLDDKARSGQFHVDVISFQDEITRAFFDMMHRKIDQFYETAPYLDLKIGWTAYNFVMDEVASYSMWRSGRDIVFPLITRISEKLFLLDEFYTGRSMDSLAFFIQDIRRLECCSRLLSETLWPNRHDWNQSNIKGKTVKKAFQDAVFLAQKRAMLALALLPDFRITPTLVYLAEFYDADHDDGLISPSTLTSFPGVNGDLVTLARQHDYILKLSYFPLQRQWSLRLANLRALLDNWDIITPRIRRKWRDQRNFVTHCLLKSVFSISPNLQNGSQPRNRSWSMLKECFFDRRSVTDICNKRDLQTACKCLSLLECMSDISSWTILKQHKPALSVSEECNPIISIISWLNRQLTNSTTLKLLQDHDAALPERLEATANYLFEEFFLSDFAKSYNKRFYTIPQNASAFKTSMVLRLTVCILPFGFYENDLHEDLDLFDEDWNSRRPDWQTFHDQLFGEIDGIAEGGFASSIIAPSRWHPYLASRLLNALAKLMYGQVNPQHSIPRHWDHDLTLNFEKTFSYLTQCLPFALPTSENLEALRLIVYLCPQIPDSSDLWFVLPEGIWPLIATFLLKYDQSVLSSHELHLFNSWLDDMGSTDHDNSDSDDELESLFNSWMDNSWMDNIPMDSTDHDNSDSDDELYLFDSWLDNMDSTDHDDSDSDECDSIKEHQYDDIEEHQYGDIEEHQHNDFEEHDDPEEQDDAEEHDDTDDIQRTLQEQAPRTSTLVPLERIPKRSFILLELFSKHRERRQRYLEENHPKTT